MLEPDAKPGAAPPSSDADPVAEAGEVVAQRRWRDVSEHGTRVGIKAVVVLATLFGRGPTRLLGFFLALYYTLRSKVARESGDELRRRGSSPVTRTRGTSSSGSAAAPSNATCPVAAPG